MFSPKLKKFPLMLDNIVLPFLQFSVPLPSERISFNSGIPESQGLPWQWLNSPTSYPKTFVKGPVLLCVLATSPLGVKPQHFFWKFFPVGQHGRLYFPRWLQQALPPHVFLECDIDDFPIEKCGLYLFLPLETRQTWACGRSNIFDSSWFSWNFQS